MAALIVVDFQNDFCPPSGSLAVHEGDTIVSTLNTLLTLPFALKVATRDWHPSNHVSFAANASPPSDPFTSSTTITHDADPSRSYVSTLWPVHCVQDSHGAQFHKDLNTTQIQHVINKGLRTDREMYSAFYDPFGESDSGLKSLLANKGITDVFVAGLAADYCVQATAEHAAAEGFRTYIVEDATKPVFPDKWDTNKESVLEKGIALVQSNGVEISQIK